MFMSPIHKRITHRDALVEAKIVSKLRDLITTQNMSPNPGKTMSFLVALAWPYHLLSASEHRQK